MDDFMLCFFIAIIHCCTFVVEVEVGRFISKTIKHWKALEKVFPFPVVIHIWITSKRTFNECNKWKLSVSLVCEEIRGEMKMKS